MSDPTSEIFKLAVPPELRAELEDAMREATAEEGWEGRYETTVVDLADAASELQFEPITTAVVLKFVFGTAVSAVAGKAVGKAVEKLIRKLVPRDAGDVRIVVMYPDGEVETIDTSDARQTNAVIDRLKGGG